MAFLRWKIYCKATSMRCSAYSIPSSFWSGELFKLLRSTELISNFHAWWFSEISNLLVDKSRFVVAKAIKRAFTAHWDCLFARASNAFLLVTQNKFQENVPSIVCNFSLESQNYREKLNECLETRSEFVLRSAKWNFRLITLASSLNCIKISKINFH